MRSFDIFISESIHAGTEFPKGILRAIPMTEKDHNVIQRESWNNSLDFAKSAILSVNQDWSERGAGVKCDAAEYILRVLETCRKRSTDIL